MNAVRPTDRVFFAVVLDQEIAKKVSELSKALSDKHGLRGTPIRPEHLHVTLWHVGDSFLAPSHELVSTLVRRASYVEMPTFRVSFDQVMHFTNGALVLRSEEGTIGLEMLQERLRQVLAAPGMPKQRFTPHVTLLRDRALVPERPVEPVTWTVREFVLVHSLLGKTTHRHLARFPLS